MFKRISKNRKELVTPLNAVVTELLSKYEVFAAKLPTEVCIYIMNHLS